eukprot:GFUD01028275.1.p1 GENE.GFUD01028275.1~~GFUD01028275.1.p1  ORF type:complete len:587 (-),score=164.45 GFUD01028275.1:57-1817(-)
MSCMPQLLLLLLVHESLFAPISITTQIPVAIVSNSTNSPKPSQDSTLAANHLKSTPLPKSGGSNSTPGIQQSKANKEDDMVAKISSRASTWVLGKSSQLKVNDTDDIIAEYADKISIEDEFEIGDEALVLAHLEKDINDFEDLKKTIAFLEKHISKHSDVHVVASQDLVDADHMLKDLDLKVIKPFEQQLVSLKSQIVKLNNKFDNEFISEFVAIVVNAEMFLETSLEKVEEVEQLEQDWEVAEDTVKIEDELETGDEALVLTHLEKDINDFEDLKKTIAFLEKHISKHSDIHVVASQDLVDADHMLKDLDVKVIIPYEQQLVSLKSQIVKLNNKFDNETISEIVAIVVNAEMFLKTSLEGVEEVEQLDQEWEVAEATVQIQEMIDLDESETYDGKIIIEALKPIVSDKVKKKLGNQDDQGKDAIVKISEEKSNRRTLELQMTGLRQVKADIEREVFEDLKGRDIFANHVEHSSTGVKEALETAKEISREFIEEKLHQDAHEKEEETSDTYQHVFLAVIALVVIVVVLVAFGAFTRRKRSRVVLQNLVGVGGCDRSYMELESVKEDDGWDRGWSPWSVRKNQHKFN